MIYAATSWVSEQPVADLIFYQRDDCRLCDVALAILAQAQIPDFDAGWVDDSPELLQRYGTRVPVLRDTRDGRELAWPFDATAVRAFVRDNPAA